MVQVSGTFLENFILNFRLRILVCHHKDLIIHGSDGRRCLGQMMYRCVISKGF